MLRRMSSAGAPRILISSTTLWHNLGLIYRDRLADTKQRHRSLQDGDALQAGDEAVERQILAELFEATDQMEAAIGEHAHRASARSDARRSVPQPLQALLRSMHEYDRAWCMCAALAFLKKADAEEQQFFEDYRPRGMIQVKSRLDNEQWVKNLFHKDESLYVGKIFEMITPAAIVAKTNAASCFASASGSRQTLQARSGYQHRYLREDVRLGRAGSRNSAPRALRPERRAGRAHGGSGDATGQRRWSNGAHRVHSAGAHVHRRQAFVGVSRRALHPQSVPDAQRAENDAVRWRRRSSRTTSPSQAEMAQAVNTTAQELVKIHAADSPGFADASSSTSSSRTARKRILSAGSRRVEITAMHGRGSCFVPISRSQRGLSAAEPQLPGDLSPTEKMKELIVFSVSEQYFALRKTLGIAVG